MSRSSQGKANKPKPKAKAKGKAKPITPPDERKEPYALVLYDKKKKVEKGVVETKVVPKKCRHVGASCLLPNPIGYEEQEGTSAAKHSAKIIEFGHNIDFLLELPLLENGNIELATEETGAPAPKRTRMVQSAIKAERDQNWMKFDKSLSTLKNIVEGSFENDPKFDGSLLPVDLMPNNASTDTVEQHPNDTLTTVKLKASFDTSIKENISSKDMMSIQSQSEDLAEKLNVAGLFITKSNANDDEKPEQNSSNTADEEQTTSSGARCTFSPTFKPSTNLFDDIDEGEFEDATNTEDSSGVQVQLGGFLISEESSAEDEESKETSSANLSIDMPRSVSPQQLKTSSRNEEVSTQSCLVQKVLLGGTSDTSKLVTPHQLGASSRNKDKITNSGSEVCTQSSCPVQKVLSEASSSNLQFLEQLTDQSNISFLQRLGTALTTHMSLHAPERNVVEVSAEKQKNKTQPIASTKKSKCQKRNFKEFECSQQTETKWPLVSNQKVFIEKVAFCNLPLMAGSAKMVKLQADGNNEVVGITPRKMVGKLLDCLVPQEIQKSSSYKSLPEEITNAIESYINVRFPPENKVPHTVISTAITDYCRQLERDREGEKERREEKISKNIPIKSRKKRNDGKTYFVQPQQITNADGSVAVIHVLSDSEAGLTEAIQEQI